MTARPGCCSLWHIYRHGVISSVTSTYTKTLSSTTSIKKITTERFEISRPQSPTFLIFGANTDVGKTVLTAALINAATSIEGMKTHYIKPLQCGGSDENFIIRHVPNLTTSKTLFRWETPASPHVASRMENHPVSDGQVLSSMNEYLDVLSNKDDTKKAHATNSSTWIETAGGVLSPSSSSPKNNTPNHGKNKDGWGWMTQGDLYRPLREKASIVLIGDGRLGGISVTLTTLESLLHRKYNISGILLLRHGQDQEYDEDTNREAIIEYIQNMSKSIISTFQQSPIFQDPESCILSLPRLPPEPEPLTDWYRSNEVQALTSSFVSKQLVPNWQKWQSAMT